MDCEYLNYFSIKNDTEKKLQKLNLNDYLDNIYNESTDIESSLDQSDLEKQELNQVPNLNKNQKLNKNCKKYICCFNNCGSIFYKKYRYERHLRVHTGEKPFVCQQENCDKSFACKSYLKKHSKRPHNCETSKINAEQSLRFTCEICDLKFKRKYNLKLHMVIHNGIFPHECLICNVKFKRKSSLLKHNKIHDGYKCNFTDCDFVGEKWTLLRKHISQNHKQKYECKECGKIFLKINSLNVHSRMHLDEKFVCTFQNCERTYVKKSGLKAHLRTHEGNFFKCDFEHCEKEFKHKVNLKQHIENVHCNPSIKKDIKKVNKPKVFIHRKSEAQALCNIHLDKDELRQILIKDKEFRQKIASN